MVALWIGPAVNTLQGATSPRWRTLTVCGQRATMPRYRGVHPGSGVAMRRLFPLVAVLALAACKNDCQKLCDEMADYAEECGQEWDREAVKECRADQANRNVVKESRDACASALPSLREEWTCEDLEGYFAGGDDDEGAESDPDGTADSGGR